MVAKVVLLVCAQALVFQSISGQCIDGDFDDWELAAASFDDITVTPFFGDGYVAAAPFGYGRLYDAALSPIVAAALTPSIASASHRVLPISSASAIAPNGITVTSENAYTGDLNVGGALPFLGTMSFEGALPNAGTGVVAYNCGNGEVGILAENFGAPGIDGPVSYREDAFGYGIGSPVGLFGRAGCGCGGYFI